MESRAGYKWPFPYITIDAKGYINFNKAATLLIGDARYCKVLFSAEFVVFRFGMSPNGAHKLTPRSNHKNSMTCLVTEVISRVKPGSYRLYKCRSGYAIKRHEPLKRKEGE